MFPMLTNGFVEKLIVVVFPIAETLVDLPIPLADLIAYWPGKDGTSPVCLRYAK